MRFVAVAILAGMLHVPLTAVAQVAVVVDPPPEIGPSTYVFPLDHTIALPTSGRRTDHRNDAFAVTRFPPMLGTLNRVTLELFSAAGGGVTGVIDVPLSPGNFAGLNANMTIDACVTLPAGAPPLCIEPDLFLNRSGLFEATVPVVSLTYGAQSTSAGPINVPSSALPQFVGSTPITLPLSLTFRQEASVSRSGVNFQFSAVTLNRLHVTYEFTPSPIPGDVNMDGRVDRADVARVAENFGRLVATQSIGDVDSDGDVDLHDVAIVQRNYGGTQSLYRLMVSDAKLVATNVPEPSTLFLAIATAATFVIALRTKIMRHISRTTRRTSMPATF